MYYGYAIDNEQYVAVIFDSCYKCRDSVRDNVERCTLEQCGYSCTFDDVVIHQGTAEQGMNERFELLIRDLENMYHEYTIFEGVHIEPREEQHAAFMRRLSREYEIKPELLKAFCAGFCFAFETDNLEQIEQYIRRIKGLNVFDNYIQYLA